MKTIPKLLKLPKYIKVLKLNWPLILGITAAFVYLLSLCLRLDPDLGWHLRVGEDMLKQHIFPRNDMYTFPFQGYAWRDHEWLAELPLYLLYQNIGYTGLAALFSVLWFLPFWWLVREKNLVYKILLILIAIAAIAPYCGVRLQVLTLIGIALLHRLFDNFERDQNKALLYLFPLIMLLWANIHGSFIYGVLVYGIFLIYAFFRKKSSLLPLGLSYLSGLAATLINPYGIGLWRELVIAADPNFKKLISEWTSLLSLPVNYFTMLYLLVFLVLLFVNRRTKLSFRGYYLASVLIFLLLAFMSRRNVTIFILLSLPLFAELIKKDQVFSRLKSRPLILKITTVTIGLSVLLTMLPSVWQAKSQDPFDGSMQNYPAAEITEKLKLLPQGTPVFASYDFGGYLIQTNPNIKVFIDGRASYWKLGNELAVKKYLDVANNESDFNWAEKNYDFQVVVSGGLSTASKYDMLFQQSMTNNTWQDLTIRLLKTGDWRVIAKNEINSQQLLVLKGSQAESYMLD